MTQTLEPFITGDAEPLIRYAAQEAISHWDVICGKMDNSR
jgi:hypothetical protein